MKVAARWWVLPVMAVALAGVWVSVRSQAARPAPAAPQATVRRPGAPANFRILLGIDDAEPTRWDGSVRITGGRITAIDIWRPAQDDRVEGQRWKLSTHRLPPQNAAAVQAGRPGPMVDNGLLVSAELLDGAAKFEIETAQGNFSFTADEVALGQPRGFLEERVIVERVPSTRQITTSVEEQDYPAVAQSGDTVYIAYVEFTHGDRAQKWPQQMPVKPLSFDPLARPAGGDQVRLIEYSKSKKTWSMPYAASAIRQDVHRVTVTVDGEGRVWVVWSANNRGNFDIYARYRKGGVWSDEMRLTNDAGPDLSPVAVTDSTGSVWLAWQGYRKDNFEILVARQHGTGFSKEERVSVSTADDWDPQIAAGKNGDVAVVWDTYEKGDYDVYLRRLRYDGRVGMDAPLPIAATQKFEARASVAYDNENRIWVAWEEGHPRWGKDYGAYETTGSGLYQGSTVRVKVLQGNRYFVPADKIDDVVEATSTAQAKSAPRRGSRAAQRRAPPRAVATPVELPDPGLASKRPPNLTPYPPNTPPRGLPRLATDSQGMVYLAYRAAAPTTRGPLGSVWVEDVAYFDGKEWTGPIFLPHSDNLLDNRPALISTGPGELLIVNSTDHRLSFTSGGAGAPGRGMDAFNNDLILAELRAGSSPRTPDLTAVPAEKPEEPDSEIKREKDQVAYMRGYRVTLGAEKLQLLRGEFHRHTELSGDGGRDGPLIDAYRYMLDAAYMDWVACCDHDNGNGREYSWWTIQKLTDAFHVPGRFVPMFGYERSVRYPEGHRNLVMARRGVRPLPRLPKMADDSPASPAPDTQMLYEYLRHFDGIVASHTSGTDMGTDWRDNDPKVEPVVEIYQGDRQNYEMPDAPRTNKQGDSIGGWRPLGFVSLALKKGYRLGFQASSDHISTHMSYCNLWVTQPTRAGVMDAFKKRRVYGATDNILAEVTANGHFMGEEFRLAGTPVIHIKLVGMAEFSKVHIIRDGESVYSTEPKNYIVDLTWRDNAPKKGATAYYYVRGEQADGELVWVSPMWITVE